MNQCTVCKSVGGFLHCGCPLSLRIQHERSVDPTRIRVIPSGVEVKPRPASVDAGGHLDLRYPSHSMPPLPKPADLAADVLDALTRKLADYDRLSASLTSAQEAATKNLERARLAEDERDSYRASVESYDADVDRLGDELRELKGRLAAVTKDRDTLSMQGKDLCHSIDKLRKELSKARADFAQAARSGACAVGQVEGIEELLGLEAGADVIGAVGQLREERNELRARLDDYDSKLTAMRAALSKAGIPEVEKYPAVPADPYERSLRAGGRVLGGVERIERLQSQRDEARAEVKGLREHLRIMRGASQEACDRLARERDDTGRKLYEAHQERDRMREERDQAKTACATVACDGSRAVSALETLRSLLNLPEDGDVVGAVRRHLDAYARVIDECDALRAANAKLRARCFEHGLADDPVAGVRSPREWNEKVKAKLDEIDFDINEAKAINSDCARHSIGTPKPGPKLTPLRAVHCQSDGYDLRHTRFSNGVVLECRCCRVRGTVERWKLFTANESVYSATYPQPALASHAMGDVNAILARYGYVLEAWP